MSKPVEDIGDDENMDDLVSDPDIVTKYQMAGQISAEVLKMVCLKCVEGAKVLDLCIMGDKALEDKVGKCFKQKGLEKGIAFPTCVSVNNCVCNNSPLTIDEEQIIKDGDLVKINLGCHIDGYIGQSAHSFVVTNDAEISGPKADVIVASQLAAEYIFKSLKPGAKSTDIAEGVCKIAKAFNVNPISGLGSQQIKRFVPEAANEIVYVVPMEERVDTVEFAEGEAYVVDVLFSTGKGEPTEKESRTTVYRRVADVSYNLKLKASRQVFNEINTKFPTMAFTLRALDEKKGRLGVREMLTHGLLQNYPVIFEKESDFVARVSFTVLLMPSGPLRYAAFDGAAQKLISEFSVEDEAIKTVLASSAKRRKNKKKKAAKKEEAA